MKVLPTSGLGFNSLSSDAIVTHLRGGKFGGKLFFLKLQEKE